MYTAMPRRHVEQTHLERLCLSNEDFAAAITAAEAAAAAEPKPTSTPTSSYVTTTTIASPSAINASEKKHEAKPAPGPDPDILRKTAIAALEARHETLDVGGFIGSVGHRCSLS